ncbi:MAG: hypothetical protein A2Y17_02410 [Clostridiales bacterium GWF2_38_85]|nr:MAG: hypothetical protein A2Y17_02410 [Clostridiales bacterium GWF2_38_85]HBL85050.1 electron transport complex subunit RsxC [Clostridiales bacterium]
MRRTFLGGVHMNEHKNTAKSPIETITPPEYVAIPMQQHIGAPCKPLVNIGDTVLIGQKIGDNPTALSCPIHSSISGTVERMEKRLTTNGSFVEYIVIKNDYKGAVSSELAPHTILLGDTSSEKIIQKVREAGVVGMGGASFPTYAKIQSAIGKASVIIINCAECEPYLTINHRLMLEHPEEIINGTKILMRAAKIKKAIIAIEDNKLDAAEKIADNITDHSLIDVEVFKTKYPQGDERQLIYALSGIELKQGQLPADVGFVIFNAESCAVIYNAFTTGMPLVSKLITVDGECMKSPKNLSVPIGISFKDIIDFCGGLTHNCDRIITGGPMMGVAQWDLNSVAIKATGAILALPALTETEPHCIRCGRCVRACQMHLLPALLAQYASINDFDMCKELNIMSCVECGCCTYICPGKVPIVQHIRNAKQELRARQALKK